MIHVQTHENDHRTFQVGTFITGHYSPKARNAHSETFSIRFIFGLGRPRCRTITLTANRYDRDE